MDSSLESTFDNATNLSEPAKDSRILEIKSVFCERVQGRILGVCNRSTREAIALFSPKQAKRSAIADVSLVKPNPPKKPESLQNSAVFFYHKDRIIPPLRLPKPCYA